MKLLFLFGFLLLCGLAFTEETQEEPKEDAELAEINDEDQDIEDTEEQDPSNSGKRECRIVTRKRCWNHCNRQAYYVNVCSRKCHVKKYHGWTARSCRKACQRLKRYRLVCKRKCCEKMTNDTASYQRQCRRSSLKILCEWSNKPQCYFKPYCKNRFFDECDRYCFDEKYYVNICNRRCYYKYYYAYGTKHRKRICKNHCRRVKKYRPVCKKLCARKVTRTCTGKKTCVKRRLICKPSMRPGKWKNVGKVYCKKN